MAIQYNELQKLLKTTTYELFVLISIFIIQKMVVLTAKQGPYKTDIRLKTRGLIIKKHNLIC